jgi:hypothetical protein
MNGLDAKVFNRLSKNKGYIKITGPPLQGVV